MFSKGFGMGMVVAGALVSGAAFADVITEAKAQTAPVAPVLYTAPAEAFPARSDVVADNTQKPEPLVVSQVDPVSDALALVCLPTAAPLPAPRPATIAADHKPVAHVRHPKERVAYLDHGVVFPPKNRLPSFMIGIGY
jgi:hypothetical protein